jgi:hypothetical protein
VIFLLVMNVERQGAGADIALGPGACKNARQYVVKRLNHADEPMRPSQLAEEYDCTPAHMRKVLGKLLDIGVVKRPERGEYTAAGDGSLDGDTEQSGSGENTEDTPEARESVPSSAGGQEGEDMPSIDELNRQRELAQKESGGPDVEAEVPDGSGDDPDESIGVPLPIPPAYLYAAVAILLVGFYWFQVRPAGEIEDGRESEQATDAGGGLIAGQEAV